MRTPLIRRRTRSLPRPIALLMTIALMLAMLAPIGEQIASAQADPTEAIDDAAEPTLEPTAADALTTEPAPEATDEVIATEEPTAIPASQLTISVYRCDHPDFDTGFSENLQRVINECTGPGSASFTIESGSGQQQGSGSTLTFEILGYLYLTEAVPGKSAASPATSTATGTRSIAASATSTWSTWPAPAPPGSFLNPR